MILLLGTHKNIVKYMEDELHKSIDDIHIFPEKTTHFSEFDDIINNEIVFLLSNEEKYNPIIINSQNIEFIERLLNSDLDFMVYTIVVRDNKIFTRKLDKDHAKVIHYEYKLELR